MKKFLLFFSIIIISFFLINADSSSGATDTKNVLSREGEEIKSEEKIIENTEKEDIKTQKIKSDDIKKDNNKSEENILEDKDITKDVTDDNEEEKIVKEDKKEEIIEEDTITNATEVVEEIIEGTDERKEELKDVKKDDTKKDVDTEEKIVKEDDNDNDDYDSIAEATETTDEIDLFKIENEKKKELVKLEEKKKKEELVKLEEEKKQEEDKKKEDKKKEEEKKDIIEFKKEETEVKYSKNDKSTMIIFKDEYDPDYITFEEDYENENNINIDNTLINVIPETIDDFSKINPNYSFDISDVLIPGPSSLNKKLGEKAFFMAYDFFKKNKLKNSRKLFEKLIYFNYKITESYYYISWCYFLTKDYINAINYMKKASDYGESEKIDYETLSDYLYQIGNIYFELEDYINSIDYFIEALNRNELSMKSYNKLGISYYKIGNKEKALETWKKGMEIGDNNSKKNYKWLAKKIIE